MYRNLNVESLGISGRQSELIELVLTYRFKGMDVDMAAVTRQAEKRGLEYACRFIESAKLKVGSWKLPVRWEAAEDVYRQDLQKLPAVAANAVSLEAHRCIAEVSPGSNTLPLQENFEFHRARFAEIAQILEPHKISLGLGLQVAASKRQGLAHQFIVTAEALQTLVKMITAKNVGILLDTWNWHLGGGNVLQAATLPNIVAVRLSDVPKGATAETTPDPLRLLPGAGGILPLADFLVKLEGAGYEGPVTPYPSLKLFKGIVRDRIVQQTADAIRGIWPGGDPLDDELPTDVDDPFVDELLGDDTIEVSV